MFIHACRRFSLTPTRTSAAALGVIFLAAGAAAQDWPQWRGPDRTGVSAETGLLAAWPDGGPPQVWRAENLGAGYGPVSVAGGRIYVQGTRGRSSALFCLDASDGRELWVRELGAFMRNDKGDGPRGAPTVQGDALYVLTGMGELARLHTIDGSIAWRRNILSDFNARNIGWGISESPLIEGDWAIVTPGGRGAAMVALNKSDGRLVWACADLRSEAGYASAIAADIGGVRAILQFTDIGGVGVRARDGKLLWQYAAPANGTANIATPVFRDNRVFYTSDYGTGGGLLRLTPNGESVATEQVYFTREMRNHHGGVVLVGDHLYGYSGAILTCMNFETGRTVWQNRSVGKGSLIAADGRLYLVSESYTVGLADASPEGYRERGRFRIRDRGRPSWAHPVVSNGRLYIRNQDELTVYNVSAAGGENQ
jgi:outer membrane protein assembly factor BamB